jgi:hypothetical protein
MNQIVLLVQAQWCGYETPAVDKRLLYTHTLIKVVSFWCVINTFAAIVDLSRFNNSCLRLLKISDDNNE